MARIPYADLDDRSLKVVTQDKIDALHDGPDAGAFSGAFDSFQTGGYGFSSTRYIPEWMEIGMVTPPLGINVFIIKSVAGDSIRLGQIFKGVAWFIVMDLITLTILILFPEITLYLPSLM